MKKSSNTKAELKKSFALKKSMYFLYYGKRYDLVIRTGFIVLNY